MQPESGELREMVLTTLGSRQCEMIHEAAVHILETTGVVFQSAEAREVLKDGGARIDGERVFVTRGMVDRALGSAPSTFTLHDQQGRPRHEVGGRSCIYGPGSDCLHLLDYRSGMRRDPLVKDLEELVTLCDALENIDFLMSMVIPSDYPREVADRKQMEIMLSRSTKPIIGVSFDYPGTRDIVEMAEAAAEGVDNLRERPFLIHYIQPVRALVHNQDTVNKLLYTARKGLPVVYLVSAIMGVTSPITAAGYQAMGAAGQLAALVLTQLVREGTPFAVRGGRIVVLDMKTMLSTFAAPENRIFSSDMAHYYDLPSFGTAGCSDSKTVDWQSVAEASLTLMADSLVGANLIHDVGYIEAGVTYSAEMLVLCDEVIGWIRKFKQSAVVNDDTLALDLIDQLGIDGNFLTSDHTLARYKEQWEPSLFDRRSYHDWLAAGPSDLRDRVRTRIDTILGKHKSRELPADLARRLRSVSDAAAASATAPRQSGEHA